MLQPLSEFAKSFIAFNLNGIYSMIYILSSNIWYIGIVLCAFVTAILKLKDAVDVTVREEQNIL